jgi:hypothetical protein
MRKIKEVLRLQTLGLKQEQIARSCGISQSTVSEYVKTAAAADITWSQIADWDEVRLQRELFPNRQKHQARSGACGARLRGRARAVAAPQARDVAVALGGIPTSVAGRHRYSRYVAAVFLLRNHLNAMTDARSGDFGAT